MRPVSAPSCRRKILTGRIACLSNPAYSHDRRTACSAAGRGAVQPQAGTPLSVYNQRVSSGVLQQDSYQLDIVKHLQTLHGDVARYQSGSSGVFWRRFRRSSAAPLGVYMWGTVGTGKTMLMDLFYQCCRTEHKRRVHFHEFMLDVHARIHAFKLKTPSIRAPSAWWSFEQKQRSDPIPPVALDIVKQSWLLCFDEFQVTDIADAMILRRLFTCMMEAGAVLVTTSNRPPQDLYKNGLQRANFVPLIGQLQKRCHVLCLDSGVDYRLTCAGSTQQQTFFVKDRGDGADVAVDRLFRVLAAHETDTVRSRQVRVGSRLVQLARTCGRLADCTFYELCDSPLGAADYIVMSQLFHTIIVRDVPVLNVKRRTQARRFITLIDTLYNHKVRVVLTAEAELQQLFSRSRDCDPASTGDTRQLIDDLDLAGNQADEISLFSGEEEIFAFDRTISRLVEMQSSDYWNSWHSH